MKLWCLIWFHNWYYTGAKQVVEPKEGPYDPRNEEERTKTKNEYICARCGKKDCEPYCYY